MSGSDLPKKKVPCMLKKRGKQIKQANKYRALESKKKKIKQQINEST